MGTLALTRKELYPELIARNAGVIDAAAQRALRASQVLIAGCGSIGGAAVEPLARLGVENFTLADPGTYEVNNLNRQNATLADMGRNKAQVAAERITAINPACEVRVFSEGVTAETLGDLTARCAVIVDGVDVTTMSGLRAKYLLHEEAARLRRPLFTGWDMAGAQYLRYYDYREVRRPFDGRLTAADLDRLGMWQLLQRLVPARFVPLEMIEVAAANLENPDFSFPQLVYAADLFGALAARIVVELLSERPVRKHTYLDLHQAVRPGPARWRTRVQRPLHAARAIARVRRTAALPSPNHTTRR
jgi:hypothetical protein